MKTRLMKPIYLDYHSTTPVDREVFEEMTPYFLEKFGNPAAKQHTWGWDADAAVDHARTTVAAWIGANSPLEIVFTSGATESSNAAIRSVIDAENLQGTGKNHIITCSIEHKSVLETCKELEKRGQATLTILPVDSSGQVSLAVLEQALTPKTALVSIMAANHEVGSIQPIEAIGKLCKQKGILFHTDATQALGKFTVDVQKMGIDLLSLSAHKIYGPKGVGALYIRRRDPRVVLKPWACGGGQERGLRSGTLNVPGIVGLGAAARIAQRDMDKDNHRLSGLRDRLWKGLSTKIDQVVVNGGMSQRLPHNLNVRFEGIRADTLMMAMKEIGVSAGSACNSENVEPSAVLKALGLTDDQARSSLRFGLGRGTTEAEIDFVIEKVSDEVRRLRDDRNH